jgi:uncharacterized protein YndB with AHSA1/START domain
MTDQSQQIRARMGEVLRDGDLTGLRFVRAFRHAPETVWAAITESEHLRHWFPADIVGERRAGAQVELPFWPESVERGTAELEAAGIDLGDPVLPGEIRSWEPHRLFELTWGNNEGPSDHLRFELEPDGDGTRLVFTTWLGVPGPSGPAGTGAGYHTCLDALETLLDSGPRDPAEALDAGDLEQRYHALIGG